MLAIVHVRAPRGDKEDVKRARSFLYTEPAKFHNSFGSRPLL